MTDALLVTLTVDQLRSLIREELAQITRTVPESDILDSDGASKLLHYSVKMVERRARNGELPALRLPGTRKWRFQRTALLAWLKTSGQKVA